MQEIKSKKIRFRNFMSYGNIWQEVIFDEGLATYILGENLDTNSRNGVGKSSILNAICYAIYNKAFSNISLPRLINSTNSSKNTLMEVEYYFNIGTTEYLIHRFRGEKTGVAFYKNGEDVTLDSINDTDKLIEQTFGRSFELFTRTIVFAGTTVPFLDLPINQQRNFFEELFNITILSEKAEKLRKVIQSTEKDIKIEEAITKEKENNYKSFVKRLNEMENKILLWEDNNEKNIALYESQLLSIEGLDFEEEEKHLADYLNVKDKLKSLLPKIESEKKSLKTAENELSKLKREYEHLVVNNCPYCLQQMPNATEKIIELSTVINEVDEIINDFNLSLESLIEQETQLTLEQKQIKEQLKYENLSALLEIKSNAAVIKSKLELSQNEVNPYLDAYELLEKENIEQVNYSNLNELKSSLEHQQFLLKLLTDKNSFIRKKIISKTLPFLNIQINEYSKNLGLPHIIEFKDDMSCEVSELGRVLDFGNLSGGESKRLNLAMSLAFRDVLSHLHAKDNLLFVDEIDASLCDSGVDAVIKVLKQKTHEDNLSSWIIMHRSFVTEKFDKVLSIKKQHGFSEIIYS